MDPPCPFFFQGFFEFGFLWVVKPTFQFGTHTRRTALPQSRAEAPPPPRCVFGLAPLAAPQAYPPAGTGVAVGNVLRRHHGYRTRPRTHSFTRSIAPCHARARGPAAVPTYRWRRPGLIFHVEECIYHKTMTHGNKGSARGVPEPPRPRSGTEMLVPVPGCLLQVPFRNGTDLLVPGVPGFRNRSGSKFRYMVGKRVFPDGFIGGGT